MSAIGSRINTLLLVVVTLIGVAIIAMLATGVRGGPLDPASGPASTDGVREPGTPISSLPFTISSPGRYYVTRDLTGTSGQSGVTIAASDVTLDLHGFTLHGVPGSIDGVLVNDALTNAPLTNIVIEHGSVRGWYNGIDAALATLSKISRVNAIGNGGVSADGSFGLIIGAYSEIEDCNVSANAATGIRGARIVVRNCTVERNGNDGVSIFDNSLIQGIRATNNYRASDPSGPWADVHMNGLDTTLNDSSVGQIIADGTSFFQLYEIARNTYCRLRIFPPNASGNELDNLQAVCLGS